MDRRRNICMGRLTAWEVIDAFPDECKTILPREIRGMESELKPFLDIIENIREDMIDDFERDFWIEVTKIFMPSDLLDLYERSLKIKRLYKMKKYSGSLNDIKLNIER